MIGSLCSLIPGTGPTIASFVAYATEKKISKHPEKFGTGLIEGVVCPEASTHSFFQVGEVAVIVFVERPISAVFVALCLILIGSQIYFRLRGAKADLEPAPENLMRGEAPAATRAGDAGGVISLVIARSPTEPRARLLIKQIGGILVKRAFSVAERGRRLYS
ncbi:MAG: tripartite tricarboxylate transporter permease [Xanthobacteraceae bacterium]